MLEQVQGMSTRRGTVKFLDDILNDVGESMHDVMRRNEDKYRQVQDADQVADILGISAVSMCSRIPKFNQSKITTKANFMIINSGSGYVGKAN